MSEPIYHRPTMVYSVKLNGVTTESGAGQISFQPGYNTISVDHKCTNQSINNYQIWITKATETNWGLGIGKKALENSNSLAANTQRTVSFTATSSLFDQLDGSYRLALCARGDIDMTWDVAEVLLEVTKLVVKPTDSDAVDLVVTDLNK